MNVGKKRRAEKNTVSASSAAWYSRITWGTAKGRRGKLVCSKAKDAGGLTAVKDTAQPLAAPPPCGWGRTPCRYSEAVRPFFRRTLLVLRLCDYKDSPLFPASQEISAWLSRRAGFSACAQIRSAVKEPQGGCLYVVFCPPVLHRAGEKLTSYVFPFSFVPTINDKRWFMWRYV